MTEHRVEPRARAEVRRVDAPDQTAGEPLYPHPRRSRRAPGEGPGEHGRRASPATDTERGVAETVVRAAPEPAGAEGGPEGGNRAAGVYERPETSLSVRRGATGHRPGASEAHPVLVAQAAHFGRTAAT